MGHIREIIREELMALLQEERYLETPKSLIIYILHSLGLDDFTIDDLDIEVNNLRTSEPIDDMGIYMISFHFDIPKDVFSQDFEAISKECKGEISDQDDGGPGQFFRQFNVSVSSKEKDKYSFYVAYRDGYDV